MTRIREGLSLAAIVLAACGTPSEQKLKQLRDEIEGGPPPSVSAGHDGPGVAPAATGTGRFVRFLLPAFRRDRAMKTATLADGFYREPGNDGYEAVIDHVHDELEKIGFGKRDMLRLEVFETKMSSPAWTPRRGSVVLRVEGSPDRTLHAFSRPEDRDRTILPKNAPSANVEGPAVLGFDRARAGCVLVLAEPLTPDRLKRAQGLGAVAVLSSALAPYNVDPTPAARHLDAVAYASVPADCPLPVAMISPRSAAVVRDALAGRKEVRIALEAEVELADRPLRTVVATVEGAREPDDAVVLPAHVQEPGACDNASGVATLLEDARVLAELLEKGNLEVPQRSIAFVFGEEMEQSRVWLEKSGRTAIAAIAVDMTGESKKETGAEALLERGPDPGAVEPLPPDAHTAWGSSEVDANSLAPNGLSVIARCALVDVGGMTKSWKSREHPYEGGSDHSVFAERGIPAVLFWHFPDFTYHTSLDRMPHVDADEMRRMGGAILATALGVADARPFDMDRYLASLATEQRLRVDACEKAAKDSAIPLWKNWCRGARLWLADLCLGRPREDGAREARKTEEKP